MIARDQRVLSTPAAVVAVLGLALGLAACSGLRSSDPVMQVYPLQPRAADNTAAAASVPAAPSAAGAQPVAATLAVVLPVAAPGLNSTSIALSRADGVLDAYAASRWPEVLPEVLQPLIIDALRAGGRFASVQADNGPFQADYLLQVEVRQFAAVYAGDVHDSSPVVQVHLVATLGRRADRSVLRSFAVHETAVASGNRMSAVIAAYNSALGAALQRLVAEAQPPP
jgi:ABC-type uncharacterized transport system auxiliary subunit